MDYLRDANVRLAVVTSVAVVKERTNLAQQVVNVLTALTSATLTGEDTSLLDVTVEEYLDEVSHTDSTGNKVIGEDNSVSEDNNIILSCLYAYFHFA